MVVAGGIGAAGNVTADKFYTTTGIYWSGNGASYSSGGAGLTYTANTAPPGSSILGDQWYNTATDVLYEYASDGTSDYWIDIQSPTLSSNAAGGGGSSVASARVVGYNLVFGG